MIDNGQKFVFGQLIDRHGHVQVPMIQRDYAQGRESAAEVREEFLEALHSALSLPTDNPALPLNLDFIYGCVEDEDEKRFLPLDGQQRLTTLFLLHWYLAWRDGCWDEFSELFCPHGNSRFSYKVRQSSTEFYDALVKFQPDESPESVESLSFLVTNQPWYFRYWRLDTTIQSSLRMLDAIHRRFRASSGFYKKITSAERPTITFQLLDLDNFGLSDDLYIKKNARGKPLTAFESFKARYEQDLETIFDGETRSIGDEILSVAEFVSRRMDTAWADFFWGHRDEDTNLYDDAVMNLFRMVALLSRDPESDSYLDDIATLRNTQVQSSYSLFYNKRWLDRNFSELLILLLETWSKGGDDFVYQLPDSKFFDEASIFRKSVNEPTTLSFAEIVQFVGYVVFMREHSDSLDSDAFQEWMRVVLNLSANTSYDRPADMQRSISALKRMAPISADILKFFAATKKPTSGFFLQQVSEEKLKAELILADAGWKPLIDRAENHGYFRGQIEFLLDFCGALGKWKDPDNTNWKAADHNALQDAFEEYLEKAEEMFTAQGLTYLKQYRWERALLCIGNYFLPSGRGNISFLVNSSTEPGSWKRLLRGTGRKTCEARRLLKKLLDRLTTEASFRTQLDEIIDGAKDLDPWRQAFIDTPKAFGYCQRRAIRRKSKNEFYLLKKTQLNGAHAELFTYCLFHNKLLPMASDVGFGPLELCNDYYSSIGIDVEPRIQFTWFQDECSLTFDVEWNGNLFIIYVDSDSIKDFPSIGGALRDRAGFTRTESTLVKEASLGDVSEVLQELGQALLVTSNPK